MYTGIYDAINKHALHKYKHSALSELKKYKTQYQHTQIQTQNGHSVYKKHIDTQYKQKTIFKGKKVKKPQRVLITLNQHDILDLMKVTSLQHSVYNEFIQSIKELYLLCNHKEISSSLTQEQTDILSCVQDVTLYNLHIHEDKIQEKFPHTHTVMRDIFNLTTQEINMFIFLMYHAGLQREDKQNQLTKYIKILFCDKQNKKQHRQLAAIAKKMLQKLCSIKLKNKHIIPVDDNDRPQIETNTTESYAEQLKSLVEQDNFAFTTVAHVCEKEKTSSHEEKYNSIINDNIVEFIRFYVTIRGRKIEQYTLNENITEAILLNLSTIGEMGMIKQHITI